MLTNAARVLAIIFIVYLSVLALDIFNIGFPWTEAVVAFLIHLVPAFLTIICLVVAWRRQMVGGILFLLLAVGFTLWFRTYRNFGDFAVSALPLLLIGLLFILGAKKKIIPKS